MCGINGLIGFRDHEEIIRSMNRTLRHRGPDADGLFMHGRIALGHTRLSIIDPSPESDQPFVKDGLVITYNGEIYNFPELKEGLQTSGIRFRTRSDTEVVLELFRKHRERAFSMLTGMFALAVYDLKKQELFLARDHFGIKPLYYMHRGDRFAFSSEIKALKENLPGFRKEIDMGALVSCMNYLWIYGEKSIFSDIRKLPPAHYMRIDLARGKTEKTCRRYWELEPSHKILSEKDMTERLQSLLQKSIRRHLISDVPVGGFLSGGMDSSLVCMIARKYNPDLSTYTISVSDKDRRTEKGGDDRLFAERLAKEHGIDHTGIEIRSVEVLKNLESVICSLDEPIGDPAAINTSLICSLARQKNIKVLLSGMGADEIFAGYRRQLALLMALKMSPVPEKMASAFKKTVEQLPVRTGRYGLRSVRWLKRFLSITGMGMSDAYMRSYSYYSRQDLSSLFAGGQDKSIDELYSDHAGIFYRKTGLDTINRMCYTDIHMFMEGLNLTYTDRASMSRSVEVRVPFIDREVVEFAMTVPGELKIRKNVSKYILKKAAKPFLPGDIISRPKASFGMPIRSWISYELREMVDDLLSEKSVKDRGFFDPGFIKRLIREDRAGKEDNAYRIYQFLTLELWARKFLDR